MRSNPSISFVATGSVELLDESTPITSITLRPSEGSYRLYDLNIWVECLTRGTKSTDDDAKQEEGNLDGARKQSSLDKLFGATNAQPSPHAFDYEVQFDNESLGLVIHETQSLPVVEENNSGLPKPFEGDLVSVVAGVDLMLHQEPYQTAIALVKSNPRPLKIGFVHSDRKKQESEVELLENLQTSTSSDLIIPGHDGTNETDMLTRPEHFPFTLTVVREGGPEEGALELEGDEEDLFEVQDNGDAFQLHHDDGMQGLLEQDLAKERDIRGHHSSPISSADHGDVSQVLPESDSDLDFGFQSLGAADTKTSGCSDEDEGIEEDVFDAGSEHSAAQETVPGVVALAEEVYEVSFPGVTLGISIGEMDGMVCAYIQSSPCIQYDWIGTFWSWCARRLHALLSPLTTQQTCNYYQSILQSLT